MKGLEVSGGFLVARSKATIMPHPCQTSLDDVTRLAQTAAMSAATDGQERQHHEFDDHGDHGGEAIAAIALQDLGLSPFAVGAFDLRQPVDDGGSRLIVALIRGTGMNCQGNALGVDYDVAFAAQFGSVGGIGAGVDPPKSARTEALSMTARDQSMPPASSSFCSRIVCSFGQMPSLVQSRKRRQHVVGEGGITDESADGLMGTSRQASPPRRTNKMPSRQRRSSAGGAPPLDDFLRTGKSGFISFHRASVTIGLVIADLLTG